MLGEGKFKKPGRVVVVSAVVVFFMVVGVVSLGGEIIKNPKPTHFEKDFVNMIKVAEIPAEFDDTHFFARPIAMTVDDEGALYVFDQIMKKIYKFDRRFRFVKAFGKTGQGPGEYLCKDFGYKKIYFGKDGLLYVTDGSTQKIIVFDKDGEHIRDIRIRRGRMFDSLPVVDQNGNLYIAAGKEGVINMCDMKGEIRHTFLTLKHLTRFIILDKKEAHPGIPLHYWVFADNVNTHYDAILRDRFILYLTHSSSVYLFRKTKLVKNFDLWPEKALKRYRKKAEKFKGTTTYTRMFGSMFVDKDDEMLFYLPAWKEGGKGPMLYRFNVKGELVNILTTENPVRFQAKRHGFFYGRKKDTVLIYKEQKE